MQRAKDAQNSQPKDSPDIMFVKFFGEEYLPATKYIMVIRARPHCVQVKRSKIWHAKG